ncbi:RHS repeat-associated core domain-containing protein [Streptomyces sp. NPDC050392]|uniref:RHS repeat domain-containing protein n=1 Tax=Streptomyces sp. NPDC050392 TaxID=3155782 RepID=UPI00343BB203
MFTGLLGGPVAAAAELHLLKLSTPDPVPTTEVKQRKVSLGDEASEHAWKSPPKVSWPAPQTVNVDVPATGRSGAGTLPIAMGRSATKAKTKDSGGPGRVQVQVLERKAAETLGVDGVLFAVRPVEGSKGQAEVSVDYSGFQYAYGGDWASRLTLRQIPVCALTTPHAKGCATGTTLKTTNDTKSGTLSAAVTVPTAPVVDTATPVSKAVADSSSATGLAAASGTVLLAATAEASGSAGTFNATSLSPSASWTGGSSSGSFTWQYPIEVPDVPGGTSPDLKLAYSSQSIDGRTAATNNQANSIGDGWSMEPGYIERQYISCADDTTNSNTTAKVGDLCWKKDNAVINLGGQSNTLVKDTASGKWHLQSDDGTTVEKLTDTTRANKDNDGEYWVVTTPDGTKYHFGYNHLPGWTTGKAETNSTWTVPVFGNQTGEPCHATAFADSMCQQAWRWNLDYVEDPHSDAMAYFWNKEVNYYGRNVNPNTGASTATEYIRGGSLARIEYGLRVTANTVYSTKAAGKVDFTNTERCLSTCTTFDKDNAKYWPDVPFDRYCAKGTECKDRYSPSFWTRTRVTKIETSLLTGGVYKPVDTWALAHQFPNPGNGRGTAALWLASITRTGHTGSSAVTPLLINFLGTTLANRVEGATTGGNADPVSAFWRYRVNGIVNESGGRIGVTYTEPDCTAGDIPTPTSNNRRCYPVKWSPPDAPGANYEPYLDWFHTYVVTQVLEADNDAQGKAPVKQSDYTYLDGMGWAKSKDDEFTQAKYLTYGDRKGYGRVQVRTGSAPEQRTLEEYRYFRGIEGAQVKDSAGVAVTDREAFAGMAREEAVYNGDGGKLETATSYVPWLSAATATETRAESLPAVKAYATAVESDETRTAVGSAWRKTRMERTFDGVGQTLTESSLGDTAKSGDEECTTTTYVKNAAKNILNLVSQTQTVAKACGTSAQLPQDLISTTRYYYDGATGLTTAPVKGDITRRDEQDKAGTGYLTTATYTYDQHGRAKTSTDALQNTTKTDYVPAINEAPTSTTVTNALGHTATTTYEPARGVATAQVDANGKRTDAVYDALGRVTKVWQPGWAKADHADKPSTEYAYTISRTAANAITTKTLKQNGDYRTTYALFDGLLRERQTQAPAAGTPDRIMTETLYDSHGWPATSYSAYYATGAPAATIQSAAINTIPAATQNKYDGMGRITDVLSVKDGDEQWRTTTVYAGDRTTVIPPKGGTASTTVTDALGRTTELLQYTDAARTALQKTSYTYGKYDEPATVTDPAGNTWTSTFDYRGQKTRAEDPDSGTTTTAYDDLGRATTVTDARNIALTNVYDALGRKTETKQGTKVLAKWTYDTLAKGQLTSSTRYVDGAEYTTAAGGYNDRNQPTSTTVSVPAAAGGLAGTYTWSYGYNTETGALEWTLEPAVGNVPSEHVTTLYNSDDQPLRTTGQRGALVNSTLYDVFNRPTRTEFGNALGQKVYQQQVYDEHTGRMTRQTTDRDIAPQRIDDRNYAYDDAGNVTGLKTVSGQDAQQTTDNQCFTTDPLGRLTEAWTAKSTCTTTPATDTVGGPDAYWQSFAYDKLGNRTKQTEHSTTTTGTDATTTYTHPAAGADRPHAVQQATVTGGADNGRTSTFTYDNVGNTTKRTIGTTTQDLDWDAEGHLATLTQAGKTTSYTYDADGNRIIAKNADGSSTLTLPSGNELTLAADGTKTATRYYTHNGETVAMRTGGTISYLISDHQGTAMTAVTAVTLALTRRTQLPFGQLRTEQSNAFGTRGYVGGTNDPTGLTHLGAREYDPTLGRFLSVDPIIDINQPAQMNAYSYGHNNPLTLSDPDGLCPADLCGNGYPIGGTGQVKGDKTRYTKNTSTGNRWKLGPYVSKSGKAVTFPGKKTSQQTAALRRAQIAIAAAKKAEAQRRKKLDIINALQKGFNSTPGSVTNKVLGAVVEAGAEALGVNSSKGACVSGGVGFMVSVELSGCLMITRTPDGHIQGGWTTSESVGGFGFGGSVDVTALRSNADDIGQFAGIGQDVGGTVNPGVGGSFNHEKAIGTYNSQGKQVQSIEAGIGIGLAYEGYAGVNKTQSGKWFRR